MNTKTSKESEEKAQKFSPELLDELIGEAKTAQELLGSSGVIKSLSKALLERMLEGELSHHLGYEKYDAVGKNSGNSRNGRSKKTLKGEFGELDLAVPRDRQAAFEPVLIRKYETCFAEFDEKIVSLYARGISDRDIAAQVGELYGVEVSHGLISQVVSAVMSEVTAWQNRALEEVYPIVYFDALVVKVRQEKQVVKKHLYLALAINVEGDKELLGMWLAESEGAKFWLGVMNELRNRGVKDMFIACVDGLTGFPEAVEATFPRGCVSI